MISSGFIDRGDRRLRLRRIVWHYGPAPGGRAVRRWEVSFDRGPQVAVAIHPRFTVALLQAVWRIYVPECR